MVKIHEWIEWTLCKDISALNSRCEMFKNSQNNSKQSVSCWRSDMSDWQILMAGCHQVQLMMWSAFWYILILISEFPAATIRRMRSRCTMTSIPIPSICPPWAPPSAPPSGWNTRFTDVIQHQNAVGWKEARFLMLVFLLIFFTIEVATQRKHLSFGRCHFPEWSVSILETMWIHGLNFEHLKCRIPSRLNRATTLTLFRILKIQTSLHMYAHFIQSLTSQCYFQMSLRIKQFPTAHNCTTYCFTCNAKFNSDNFTTKAMYPPRRQSQSLSPWIYTWQFRGSKFKAKSSPQNGPTGTMTPLFATHSQSVRSTASFKSKWMSLGHGPDRPSPNRSAGNLHL